ncbi:MAG TPA: hypothetical protein VER55_12880, partial [Ardenticatenaceae bacterium]|nr:hypothetical protein [Ardenticatenaceae bacterium]
KQLAPLPLAARDEGGHFVEHPIVPDHPASLWSTSARRPVPTIAASARSTSGSASHSQAGSSQNPGNV